MVVSCLHPFYSNCDQSMVADWFLMLVCSLNSCWCWTVVSNSLLSLTNLLLRWTIVAVAVLGNCLTCWCWTVVSTLLGLSNLLCVGQSLLFQC